MNPDDRSDILHDLVEQLERRKLDGAARFVLDAIAPLGFLASQTALLTRPFIGDQRWHGYLTALSDEAGWEAFHRLLDGEEC
jgi:hypothetical protein